MKLTEMFGPCGTTSTLFFQPLRSLCSTPPAKPLDTQGTTIGSSIQCHLNVFVVVARAQMAQVQSYFCSALESIANISDRR